MKTSINVIAGLTRNPLKAVLSLLVLVGLCTTLQAQTADPDLNREMTIEKDYVPTVKDANKINRLPDVTAPTAPKTPVQFANYMSVLDMPSSLSPLKSTASAFGSSDQLGYVTLGVSTLPDFSAEAGFQILRTPTDRLNIYGSHRSGNYTMKYLQTDEKYKKKINDNTFGLNYLHRFADWKVFADAQYTYAKYNDYGYHDYLGDIDNWNDNLFSMHLGAASNDKDELSFLINATYTLFNQKYGAPKAKNENRLVLDFDLNAPLDIDKHIGVEGSIKNYSYSNLDPFDSYHAKNDYTALSVAPYMLFEGENWQTHLGLSVNKQFGNYDKFLIAPDVRFHVQASDQVLFYISATGGFTDNSNYELFYQNRYIDPALRVKDSRTLVNAKFGADFVILPNLNVDVHTGYRVTDDDWFLVNDYSLVTNTVAYGKAKVFNIGGAVRYTQSLVDFELTADYNHWDVSGTMDNDYHGFASDDMPAFNKPSFIANLKIGYKPVNSLRFDLIYHLEADRQAGVWALEAIDPLSTEAKLDTINDLSLKGTYAITKNFSVFVAVNNLLFQKYDLTYGYPANPFNLMGGISYKF
ncbi:MAG: hypothetical protein LBN93_10325 [Candidatus Symbiothrix sp.]|jgi:hypothetical protein|nr:hypothetical protein [Candidatus Symbiothrix sp.]